MSNITTPTVELIERLQKRMQYFYDEDQEEWQLPDRDCQEAATALQQLEADLRDYDDFRRRFYELDEAMGRLEAERDRLIEALGKLRQRLANQWSPETDSTLIDIADRALHESG